MSLYVIHWHSRIFFEQTEYHVEFLYLNNKRNYEKYKRLMDRYTDDFQPVEVKGIKSF